jgi:hypothetical protein
MCLHHIRVSYPAGTVVAVAAFARAPSAAGGPGHYRHGYRVTPGTGGGLTISPTAWSALMVDIPLLEADPLHQITSTMILAEPPELQHTLVRKKI